jgi:hypothetical protein
MNILEFKELENGDEIYYLNIEGVVKETNPIKETVAMEVVNPNEKSPFHGVECHYKHFRLRLDISEFKHPTQKFMMSPTPAGGQVRFELNEVIRFLLDQGPFNLDMLNSMNWDSEDMSQLYQLIGCSVDLHDTYFRKKLPEYTRVVNEAADAFQRKVGKVYSDEDDE